MHGYRRRGEAERRGREGRQRGGENVELFKMQDVERHLSVINIFIQKLSVF